MPTFDEIKKAVKDMNIHPSQLYTQEDLTVDRVFAPIFVKAADDAKVIKESTDKIKKLEDDKKSLEKNTHLQTAKDRLNKLITSDELKLTKIQQSFITENFNENVEDLSDEGLKGFVQKQQDLYKKWAKLTNFKDDSLPVDKKSTGNGTDITKAENNEYLEEDIVGV